MIQFETNYYSTSPKYATQRVYVEVTHDKLKVLNNHQELIMKHQRFYGKQQISMKWTTYFHLLAKRPMAIKYSSVYQELPAVWQTYLEKCTIPEK